jgi:hypothetical protein
MPTSIEINRDFYLELSKPSDSFHQMKVGCPSPAVRFWPTRIRDTEIRTSTRRCSAIEQLGQLGNSRRRFFRGPGLNNFDMALAKTTRFTESKELQLRLEAFHVFNHAQFSNPTGEINSQPVWIRNLSATCPDRAIGVRLLF